MERRQAIGIVVVVAGCLTLGAAGTAGAVDADGRASGPPAAATDPATNPGDARPTSDAEKHYVEIPFGRHAAGSGDATHATSPPPAPVKPPTTPQVDAALRELGDADFRTRESATARLQEMGAAAVPALRYTRDTASDPEVASRADAAIRNIEDPPPPKRPRDTVVPYHRLVRPQFGGDFQPLNGNLNLQLRQGNDGRRKLEVREPGGRIVRIEEGPDGIRMSVTTQEDGKSVTRDFEAATAEQLKAKDAEAFELYNRWSGRAGGAIRPPQLQLERRQFEEAFEERMRQLRRQQREQRKEWQRRRAAERAADGVVGRDLGAADEALGVLDAMRRRQDLAEHAIIAGQLADELPGDVDALLEEMRPHADELLAEITDLQRQVALHVRAADVAIAGRQPPPAVLGVAVFDDPAQRGGAVVARVLPGSRAERLGLKHGDVIRVVNGRPIAGAEVLRPAIAAAAAAAAADPLVIEVTRDEQPVKLSETAER